MNKSESIKELAAALAKAQGDIRGAMKDASNPHFRNSYATLASVWDAIRAPLSRNGLAVVQLVSSSENEIRVETILMHSSGEFISEVLPVPASKHDAQGYGSAITYGRRYGLQAIAGVAPEDDDGNAAAASAPQRAAPERSLSAEELAAVSLKLEEAAKGGTASLHTAWTAIPNTAKVALKDLKEKLKHRAADADAAKEAA